MTDSCCPAEHECCPEGSPEECCPPDKICCYDQGCCDADRCCDGGCCAEGTTCLCALWHPDEWCLDFVCCSAEEEPVPCRAGCRDGDTNCWGEHCCEDGEYCCEGTCCALAPYQQCCAGMCCEPGEICCGEECCTEEKCCGDICCEEGEGCCITGVAGGPQFACVPADCTLTTPNNNNTVTGCPGTETPLTIIVTCNPDCQTLILEVVKDVPGIEVIIPDSPACDGAPHNVEIVFQIAADAEPGPRDFHIYGRVVDANGETQANCQIALRVVVCGDDPDAAPVCCAHENEPPFCCPKGSKSCCDGECCRGICCDGECCDEDVETCCDVGCCPPMHRSCCEDECCAGACCEDGSPAYCCPGYEYKTCCAGECCEGPCCEGAGECCPAEFKSCCNNECCDGECCNNTTCCTGGRECCGGQCCETASQVCCEGECEEPECGFGITQNGVGCPGETVELKLRGRCLPECLYMGFSVIKSSPWFDVHPPLSIPCTGSEYERTFSATIYSDAPIGAVMLFQLIGRAGTATCQSLGTMTVIQVDLDVDSDNDNGTGPPDRSAFEESIETTGAGKLLCANNDDDDGNGVADKDQEPPHATENDLVPMILEFWSPVTDGTWRLQYDESKIQVYESDRRTVVPVYLEFTLPINPNPMTFWIEGLAGTHGAATTITVEVDPDGDGAFDCFDSVAMTVLDSFKVPLGMSVSSTDGPVCCRAYMPTKWGGKLDIRTTAGAVTDLAYPDGSPYPNATETGEDKHGWYTFKVVGGESYMVSALFTQEGQSATRPWNFYWWSTNPPLLNLYETTGPYQPLVKYDARHGTTARAWEAANHNTQVDWCGHCLGGSIASITLKQPTPVAGSAYNRDELEGLWSELGENIGHTFLPGGVLEIPAGPPVVGADATDAFAPRVHNILEKHVKSARIPLYAELRSDGGAVDEVWNHAVFKFVATFEEAPGDDEKVVKIVSLVTANDDHKPPTDDMGTRDPEYAYIISYGTDGQTRVGDSAPEDWISVGGEASFAPSILAALNVPSWMPDNPHVIEANVRADDAGN